MAYCGICEDFFSPEDDETMCESCLIGRDYDEDEDEEDDDEDN